MGICVCSVVSKVEYLICNKSFFILREIAILCFAIFVTIRKIPRIDIKQKEEKNIGFE